MTFNISPRIDRCGMGTILRIFLEDPPYCYSGIIRIEEDPNIIPIIPYSHYYWVGGPPKEDWAYQGSMKGCGPWDPVGRGLGVRGLGV